jgi:hypothetical protein
METEHGGIEPADGFQVATWMHLLGGFVSRYRGLWIRLGNVETRALTSELAPIDVRQPVYIAGLARSGSTLLLELLNQHPELSTHRYRDYPMLFTPYAWKRYLDFTPQPEAVSTERTHKDGIFITAESPEAFEEILWMAFFPDLHCPSKAAVLDRTTHHPEFEFFYRDHIRKLLLVRGGRRYLCKGNYNVTRMEYLLKMFEDARILLPVREPVWHIASLMNQHRRFCQGQQTHPRAIAHLARVGHFEFGLDRRPIHTGDHQQVRHIMDLWERGAEVEGWARYWACLHDYLADRLEASPRLKEAVMVVGYETLCNRPLDTMEDILAHCRLSASDEILEYAAMRIRPPAFHRPQFLSDDDLATIECLTQTTARRLGLGGNAISPAMSHPTGYAQTASNQGRDGCVAENRRYEHILSFHSR